MPFGLSNAPATFQSIMNHVFNCFLRNFFLVFFYDILIYSEDMESHFTHLHKVLTLLREHRLFAKPAKCAFGQSHIEYLGHIISSREVQADPSKIEAMISWNRPNSLKSLGGFLGLTGYYMKFIKNYGVIAKPLTNLLKKDAFIWSDEAIKSFEALKNAMASNMFVIKTDQQSLKHLLEQKVTTYLQQKSVSKLLGLDYVIQYKQGKDNVVADALSRSSNAARHLMAISVVQSAWMHDIACSYLQDRHLQHILAGIIVKPESFPLYDEKEDILRYKERIVLGNDLKLRQRVMEALHYSVVGGHSGIAGLPTSSQKNAILVVVDWFTKYSHFIALSHPFTTTTIAQFFLDHIYKLHGMPTHIISDKDRIFLSAM
ncbi:hypothetical protein LIER_07986 [Lithospermum erythrorhizon]|uniref:Reverse transcriptase domain-containing protein n=1 Tax=Lithospermum erythrorhizon TaxID=34254 RepID=A0AAV3PEW6_LITER